jgi:hypothetical protein
MSLIVSPKTGRLVKVGGKAFNDLLEDPKYRDSLFLATSPPATSNTKSVLPPLPLSALSPSAEPIMSPRLTSPSSSLSDIRMPILPPLPNIQSKLPEISSSKKSNEFNAIPTLEETLKTTRQPARRAQISEMIENQNETEGRGIKTRGWAARSPTRGKERHQLKDECGNKCFLLPEEEKFPICASPRTTGGKSNCLVDCTAVQSALIRAKQWGYDEVAEKADKLLEKCNKDGLKNFTPSKSPSKSSPKTPIVLPSLRLGGTMDNDEEYGFVRRNARRSVLFNHEEVPKNEENYDHDRHEGHGGHEGHHHEGHEGHSHSERYDRERNGNRNGRDDNREGRRGDYRDGRREDRDDRRDGYRDNRDDYRDNRDGYRDNRDGFRDGRDNRDGFRDGRDNRDGFRDNRPIGYLGLGLFEREKDQLGKYNNEVEEYESNMGKNYVKISPSLTRYGSPDKASTKITLPPLYKNADKAPGCGCSK